MHISPLIELISVFMALVFVLALRLVLRKGATPALVSQEIKGQAWLWYSVAMVSALFVLVDAFLGFRHYKDTLRARAEVSYEHSVAEEAARIAAASNANGQHVHPLTCADIKFHSDGSWTIVGPVQIGGIVFQDDTASGGLIISGHDIIADMRSACHMPIPSVLRIR